MLFYRAFIKRTTNPRRTFVEVENEVEDKIEDEIEDKIDDKIDDKIEDKIEDEIEDKIEDKTDSEPAHALCIMNYALRITHYLQGAPLCAKDYHQVRVPLSQSAHE